MNRTIRMAALLAGLAATGSACAQDDFFKIGITRYDTHAQTDGVRGVGIPAGADATVSDATTVILTGERLVAPGVGVEFVIGIPPKLKATATGSVAFLGEVLEARSVSPTLLLNYHFAEGQTLRPYVGLGINYTKFTGIKSPYGWQVSLSDSWGWAAHAGLDWSLDKRWGLFASVSALKVKSDLVAVGANVIQTTIDFRPLVYSAGVSYRY